MDSIQPTSHSSEPLIFVDLETTGANFANDRIIEIGLVVVDQHGAREWSTLVNPGKPIPPFITHLTGIDSSMVEQAPAFSEVASLVLEKLQGKLFIAHNARFDYSFLKREFYRLGINFRANNLCTVKLSRKLFPEHHRHSLETLVSRFGIQVEARHRALEDARVLWLLWQQWHAMLSGDTIRTAIDGIVGRPQLPPQLDPAVVDDLPEAHGAYALLDKDGDALKVKRASNLRQQVLAHFQPQNRDSVLTKETCRIEWRETAGEFGARLAELELTAASRKPLDELCSWRLKKTVDGDFRPELVFANELDFATAKELFGLYYSRREAFVALRKLVDAHHLCHGVCGTDNSKPGDACVGFKQRACRGTCVGKEPISSHSARLMMALARTRISEWPFNGPIAIVERDEFGMHEDFHVIDHWRHLGVAHDETTLEALLDARQGRFFDPEIYRALAKALKTEKLRVITLGPSRCSADNESL